MKARNENGTIQIYTTLPIHYSSETLGTPLVDFNTMPTEIHEAEGFFEVVTPVYDPYIQMPTTVYWDEENRVFTYNIELRETPIPRPVEPVPTPKRLHILSPLEFINRLTDEEAKTILALSKTSPDVELWWIKYNKASFISLEDPQTISGIQTLEAVGILAEGRANEILNY